MGVTRRTADDAAIIRAVASRLGMPEGQIGAVLETLKQVLVTELSRQGALTLKDFAAFKLQDRKPRTLKHPQTGRIVLVPARRAVRMTPAKRFQEGAARRLEAVLVVGAPGSAAATAARFLEEHHTIRTVPDVAAAKAVLEERPATVILTDAALPPDEVCAFAQWVHERLAQYLHAFLALRSGPEGAPSATFRVLPTRWLDAAAGPEAAAEVVRREAARVAEERGYFRQQIPMEMPSTSEAVHTCIGFLEARVEELPFDEDGRMKLGAALREAVENGLRHGNLRDAGKRLKAEYLLDFEKLTFWVRDEGPGFDFQSYLENAPVGTALEIARANIARGKTGGLGIKLLRDCVDEVQYAPPGNQVSLTKFLPRAASAQAS